MAEMQKYYKVRARYPSGYVDYLDMTISPGNSATEAMRAFNRKTGEMMNMVTVEPKENGGYICVETGEQIYVRPVKCGIINSMQRACEHTKLHQKHKLSQYCAEWPEVVEAIEEIWPMKIAKIIEDPNTSNDERFELMKKIYQPNPMDSLKELPK